MAQYYDTLLAEYVKNPGTRGLGLDSLAEQFFDYAMISYDEVSLKKKLDFKDIDISSAAIYSGEDVYMTHKLYEKQQTSDHDFSILHDIEVPLLEVIAKMEITGVKIDTTKLVEIGKRLKQEVLKLQTEIYEKAGQEFNINSPKQVGEILFEKLGLPKGKKTKTGWSVSAEVLDNLSGDFPIAKNIVRFRHYSKILSTYIVGISELAGENGLVHTTYNQAVTSTGRLSSTNPNLQNIPSGDEIAGEIRGTFISRFENGSLMAFDYSQVEIRILALLSKDQNLLQAFNNGRDIHHETARFMFGRDEISGQERKIAKAVNFGVIYGISPFGLTKMIDISVGDAKIYIEKFYENYPKVREYFDQIIKECERKTYVETLFGRKRYITEINDRNKMIKSAAEREAINMPIQGTSADIIKMAMIQVQKWLDGEELRSKMIMQVHDELVFDVYPGEQQILRDKVKEIMEHTLTDTSISLHVDIGEGYSRKDCK